MRKNPPGLVSTIFRVLMPKKPPAFQKPYPCELATRELTLGGETIETTPEHPFYVLLRGWVDAGDLRPGLSVRQADGEYGAVEQVGDEAWLVHNDLCALDLADPLLPDVKGTRPVDSLYDVIGHGSPTQFVMNDDIVSAAELADEILRQADYLPGTPVRLVSCNTGACPLTGGSSFAQQLADELGVPVYSPNSLVRPEGLRFVLSTPYHLGDVPKWILFSPTRAKYSLRLPGNVPKLLDEVLGP